MLIDDARDARRRDRARRAVLCRYYVARALLLRLERESVIAIFERVHARCAMSCRCWYGDVTPARWCLLCDDIIISRSRWHLLRLLLRWCCYAIIVHIAGAMLIVIAAIEFKDIITLTLMLLRYCWCLLFRDERDATLCAREDMLLMMRDSWCKAKMLLRRCYYGALLLLLCALLRVDMIRAAARRERVRDSVMRASAMSARCYWYALLFVESAQPRRDAVDFRDAATRWRYDYCQSFIDDDVDVIYWWAFMMRVMSDVTRYADERDGATLRVDAASAKMQRWCRYRRCFITIIIFIFVFLPRRAMLTCTFSFRYRLMPPLLPFSERLLKLCMTRWHCAMLRHAIFTPTQPVIRLTFIASADRGARWWLCLI